MRSLQERTACSMSVSRNFDTDVGESFELCCATSGRIRHSIDGGVEPSTDHCGIYCTYYMHVTLIDNIIKVKGCETHFGHTVDVLNNFNNNNNIVQQPLIRSPSTNSPNSPMHVSINIDRSVKSDDLMASSTSPESSSSRSLHSQNLSPVREVEKMDTKEVSEGRDYRSEIRRVALVSKKFFQILMLV